MSEQLASLGLLGRLAVQLGMISPDQLITALQVQVDEEEPRQLGAILGELGLLDPRQIDELVQAQGQWRELLLQGRGRPLPRRRARLEGVADFLAEATADGDEIDPDLLELLYDAWNARASDLHINSGSQPFQRVDGQIVRLNLPVAEPDRVGAMLKSFLPLDEWDELHGHGDVDLAWQPHPNLRCRVSAFVSSKGPSVAFRLINAQPPSLEDLGLPSVLARCIAFHQGLVLVTGPSGCGKSSSVAALVRLVNEERPDNIITIEDPIEFVHPSLRSAVLQREVGPHTDSFASALRGALRQDPDVLLVGELRDLETVQLAISAAETGHLVLATMHTSGAAGTIDRLVGTFPAIQQNQVRAMLSESLRAIVSQRLIPRADGQGRVPACEVVFNNPSVANLIREGRTFQLANVIALSRSAGMCRMEDSIRLLVQQGLVSREELVRGTH